MGPQESAAPNQSALADEPGSLGSITIQTPNGPLSLDPDLSGGVEVPGIPVYPGAQAVGVDQALTMGGMGPAAGMDYHTPDPMNTVADFYTNELASKAEPLDRTVEILYNFEDGDMRKTVKLTEHPGFGGTKIAIYQMPK